MKILNDNKFLFFLSIFILCIIVMIARRPDLISNPQFYAEDGTVWYSQAYNLGWLKSIILPQNGYYQSISKIAAAISLNFSLASAPLVMNAMSLIIRALLVTFLFSQRVTFLSFTSKVILGCFILLMPNLEEVHANITNTHWYLSTYLFFVLTSTPPKTLSWKIHDSLVLILSGLSGPFIVFLSPIIALRLFYKSHGENLKERLVSAVRNITFLDVLFAAICLIQVIAILLSSTNERSSAPLGASVGLLSNILSTRIFLGFALDGPLSYELWKLPLINYMVNLLGIATITISFIKGDWREKSLVIFPILMLATALLKPMIHLTLPQWPRIEFGAGQRYFVITSIFWVAILLVLIQKAKGKARVILTTGMALVVLAAGSINFRLPKMPESRWDEQVVIFNNAKPGEKVLMKINPKGWSVELNKK